MKTITLDGHIWTDRGDGVYLPDMEYIPKDEWWMSAEYNNYLFLCESTSTSRDWDGVILKAMCLESDCCAVDRYMVELGDNDNLFTMQAEVQRPCIGGVGRYGV